MAGSLSGVNDKLDRAKAHAHAFDDCVAAWFERKPHTILVDAQGEPPPWVSFIWQVNEAPPVDLALIFGDILTNLRAALDYLVWQLVLANGGMPTDRHAFPCVRDGNNWASARGDRLADIDPQWIAEIDNLQPYHRPDHPERHLLAVLDAINNINKHRALPPIVLSLPRWNFELKGDLGGRALTTDWHLDQPLEDKTEFLRVTIDPPLDKAEFRLDPEHSLRIAFRDGMDHSDGWGYTTADLVGWVEDAVAIFKPAFPS